MSVKPDEHAAEVRVQKEMIVPAFLYHATTPALARKYHESKKILGPVRGFDTLEAALLWALRKHRTVLYRVSGGPMYPMPDHHMPEGGAWWIDMDVTDFSCVRHFTARMLPKDARKRATTPGSLGGNLPRGAAPFSLTPEQASALLEPPQAVQSTLGVNPKPASSASKRCAAPQSGRTVEILDMINAGHPVGGYDKHLSIDPARAPIEDQDTERDVGMFNAVMASITNDHKERMERLAPDITRAAMRGLGGQRTALMDQLIVLGKSAPDGAPVVRVIKDRNGTAPEENTPNAFRLSRDILQCAEAKHRPLGSRKRIYLATPYSHSEPGIPEERFKRVSQLAALIVKKYGHIVHSPISHSHPIAMEGGLPTDWKFWEEYDRSFIEWADELWIFRTTGWTTSTGVQGELKIAQQLGKPVFVVDSQAKVTQSALLQAKEIVELPSNHRYAVRDGRLQHTPTAWQDKEVWTNVGE